MKTLEPTLIQTSEFVDSTGGVGDAIEMDFDFGNLEGAFLLYVEYRSGASLLSAAAGAVLFGLDFDGTDPGQATEAGFNGNRNIFGYAAFDMGTGLTEVPSPTVDLRPFDIVIARNISLQVLTVGASTLGTVAAVYYKRTLFTENEVGGIIAFRR